MFPEILDNSQIRETEEYQHHNSPEVVNALVNNNQRLITFIIKKYFPRLTRNEEVFQDAFQEGNFGLNDAAEKFDPNKGIEFSTFASRCIKSTIIKHLRTKKSIPKDVVSIYEPIKKFSDGDVNTYIEILSDQDYGKSLEDQIVDREANTTLVRMALSQLKSLSDIDQYILRTRILACKDDMMSQHDIGIELEYSQVQIGRREKALYKKLREVGTKILNDMDNQPDHMVFHDNNPNNPAFTNLFSDDELPGIGILDSKKENLNLDEQELFILENRISAGSKKMSHSAIGKSLGISCLQVLLKEENLTKRIQEHCEQFYEAFQNREIQLENEDKQKAAEQYIKQFIIKRRILNGNLDIESNIEISEKFLTDYILNIIKDSTKLKFREQNITKLNFSFNEFLVEILNSINEFNPLEQYIILNVILKPDSFINNEIAKNFEADNKIIIKKVKEIIDMIVQRLTENKALREKYIGKSKAEILRVNKVNFISSLDVVTAFRLAIKKFHKNGYARYIRRSLMTLEKAYRESTNSRSFDLR